MSNKASAAKYRGSATGQQTRRIYAQQPVARQHRALHKAMKQHLLPVSVPFGSPAPPVGKSNY